MSKGVKMKVKKSVFSLKEGSEGFRRFLGSLQKN